MFLMFGFRLRNPWETRGFGFSGLGWSHVAFVFPAGWLGVLLGMLRASRCFPFSARDRWQSLRPKLRFGARRAFRRVQESLCIGSAQAIPVR